MSELRGLYAITDPGLMPANRLLEMVESALRGGAHLLQYRNKTAPQALRLAEARALGALCRDYGVPLIINDDVELALASEADGVHLGEQDTPLAQARARLGAHALIGISCYDSIERAQAAAADGADYVAFGAVFPSVTKPGSRRADLDLLRAARAALRLPICAIGGITVENAGAVFAAGADMIAVVTGVFAAADIEAECRRLADAQEAA
jgi:thiamine-phosphate pyrophosphorylase